MGKAHSLTGPGEMPTWTLTGIRAAANPTAGKRLLQFFDPFGRYLSSANIELPEILERL
jgi:hypothetical protein